ncbi:hypothetical protein [Rubripirellula reticaptiva]|nr:hypothetical protein [Rubripirellula reticaptiva]
MVRKEIHGHLIGYDLARAAMLASALKFRLCSTQRSFTGSLQELREIAWHIKLRPGRLPEQRDSLLETISELAVGHRPERQ